MLQNFKFALLAMNYFENQWTLLCGKGALALQVALQTSPCATIGRSTQTTHGMRNQAFWCMTPCQLINSNWHFGRACCLHVHGSLNLF